MILIDTQKEEFSKIKDIRVFGKVDKTNRFNGNILFIALGGVSADILLQLKTRLVDLATPADNIQYLIFDSDIPAMEKTLEESKEGIGFDSSEVVSIYRQNLATYKDSENPDMVIGINGTEGDKKKGEIMFKNAYEDIRVLLFDKLDSVYEKSPNGNVDVIIVNCIAGGTGSSLLSHIAYNVRAYGKANRWNNLRIGACILTPDVLFAVQSVYDDKYLVNLFNQNGYETLQYIEKYMCAAENDATYSYDDGTRKITIKADIFDVCFICTARVDENGYYVDKGFVLRDISRFLYNMVLNKFIGNTDETTENKLIRDAFFTPVSRPNFKLIGESSYRVPIKEIENICEKVIFDAAYTRLFDSPLSNPAVDADITESVSEIKQFLSEKAGEEIHLNVSGLMNTKLFAKPVYKDIKKKRDNLRDSLRNNLTTVEKDVPVIIKSLKLRLWSKMEAIVNKYLEMYGPFAVIELLGVPDTINDKPSRGMYLAIEELVTLHSQYQPETEYARIIDSIKQIVAKRFFTFPSAKKETENGYYDACIGEALANERRLIINGIYDQDFFGDTLRWLRQTSDRLNDLYSVFITDLKKAVDDFAINGTATVADVLAKANFHEFLPSDYVSEERIDAFRMGLISLMLKNESNIDSDNIVSVRTEMEKLYKEFFMGIGTYGSEKLIAVAFSEQLPTLQDLNIMFASPTNETRNAIMNRAAIAFTEDFNDEKLLAALSYNTDGMKHEKFISVPIALAQLSTAMKEVLANEPYNENIENIVLNNGEIVIAIEHIYENITYDMLACYEYMKPKPVEPTVEEAAEAGGSEVNNVENTDGEGTASGEDTVNFGFVFPGDSNE